MGRAAIGLIGLAFAVAPFAAGADGLPKDPYIQVSGHGELHLKPDVLHVSLTVEKMDPDLKTARADVESRASKVIEAARKLGIADKDIDAAAIYIYPEYEWQKGGGQRLVGQHVTRNLYLTLRELDRYGALVDELMSAGVTRLDNVSPDLSDREAETQKALDQAVLEAHDKAAGLAKTAGVTLGAVYSIAEQGATFAPRPMAMAGAMRAATASSASEPEYLPGEVEIDADVTVYYLITR